MTDAPANETSPRTYTIKEVADLAGIPASTIRYYHKEGLLPFVERRESGYRSFSEADVTMLRLIECLKKTGMSIKDIAKFSHWATLGDDSLEERRQMFLERRRVVGAQMADLQETLDLIQYKCWYYETAVAAGTEAIHQNGNANLDQNQGGETKSDETRQPAAPARTCPSPLVAFMAQPETAAVFDVDGVLATYEFGDLAHAAEVDGDWKTYVLECDPYGSVVPSPVLQRFIAQKDPTRVFACSVADDYEEAGKRDFVLRHYGIPSENVCMVRSKADKIDFLQTVADKLGLEPRQVVLVEDTVKTLDAAAKAGFTSCHISSFLA